MRPSRRGFILTVAFCTLLFGVVFNLLTSPKNGEVTANEETPTVEPITVAATDWPWWRGPTRNGIVTADQKPPVSWSDAATPPEHIVWKSPVPGRGHSSPTVVGDQVFLATAEAERETQSVLCYDRATGKRLWIADVHHGPLSTKGNGKSSQASSTVACDGTRLFINFIHDGAAYTTALSRDGKQLWQTKLTDYIIHQGYGSSPALWGDLVIASADNKGGGVVAAMDRGTGKIVWKQDRPKVPNYASPVILKAAGQEQLVFTGCNLVSSFDIASGKKLWEIAGATTECVTSTVTDGERVFTSGGYPKDHVSAVRADGSGDVVWENKSRVYVPSMLVSNGYLYAVTDAGIAMCWKSDTGEETWKQRIGGTFNASPILVNDLIYATNQSGSTFVFKADPKEFELVAENQLGDDVYASPAICSSRIYMRVVTMLDGKRQEMLYCLGE